MEIINLTPHEVTFCLTDRKVTIPPSGTIARVKETKTLTGEYINGIPVIVSTYGEVEDLPAPEDSKIYVVSSLVAQRVQGDRKDVYVPSDSVRDDQGRICGCRGLGRI